MIWLNPWAWLGVITVAIPIVLHLLAQRKARVQKFPTLKFLDATPLVQARRSRLSNLPLLLVRTGILVAAAAALAQPIILTPDRTREIEATLHRAIIVDTSASMQR